MPKASGARARPPPQTALDPTLSDWSNPNFHRLTKAQIAAALQTIVRLQLDDCKRAIKDGTKTIALNELEDAIRQLKLLTKRLEA